MRALEAHVHRHVEAQVRANADINFTLIGLSSGLVLACALAALMDQRPLLLAAGPIALAVTLGATATRWAALRHSARLRHKSTLQSATGIHASQLKQMATGMTGGAFNAREFLHGRTPALLRQVKSAFLLLGFALTALLQACGIALDSPWPWLQALALQAPGLISERWFFLAQARHPQNLYYQAVS